MSGAHSSVPPNPAKTAPGRALGKRIYGIDLDTHGAYVRDPRGTVEAGVQTDTAIGGGIFLCGKQTATDCTQHTDVNCT